MVGGRVGCRVLVDRVGRSGVGGEVDSLVEDFGVGEDSDDEDCGVGEDSDVEDSKIGEDRFEGDAVEGTAVEYKI